MAPVSSHAQSSSHVIVDTTAKTDVKNTQQNKIKEPSASEKTIEVRIMKGMKALTTPRGQKALQMIERLLKNTPHVMKVLADLGFQGIQKDILGAMALYPIKKPPKGKLEPEEEEYNRQLSKLRVIVENAIGAAKHFKSISQIYIGDRDKFNEDFNIACGLANLRKMLRDGSYNHWAQLLGLRPLGKGR